MAVLEIRSGACVGQSIRSGASRAGGARVDDPLVAVLEIRFSACVGATSRRCRSARASYNPGSSAGCGLANATAPTNTAGRRCNRSASAGPACGAAHYARYSVVGLISCCDR